MKLFLIRHAEAIDYETESVKTDEYRFITPKGRKTSMNVFKKIRDEFSELEKIYTSPMTRSVQTAEILAMTLKFKFDVEVVNELTIGSEIRRVVELVKRNSIFGSIALIGHNPMMSTMVSELTEHKELPEGFQKSGVCCIVYNISEREGKFLFYADPKTLEIKK